MTSRKLLTQTAFAPLYDFVTLSAFRWPHLISERDIIMEHISGVWIPVWILGVILVAGVIDLINTPKPDHRSGDMGNLRSLP
jgi:hypothetical protein